MDLSEPAETECSLRKGFYKGSLEEVGKDPKVPEAVEVNSYT